MEERLPVIVLESRLEMFLLKQVGLDVGLLSFDYVKMVF